MRKPIAELWTEIEGWLEANAPEVVPTLAPPATDDEIDAAEAALGDGVTIPPSVRALYRRHNGGTIEPPWWGLMDGWNMLDLDELVSIATDRRERKEDSGREYPYSLVPLFHNGVNGDILYVDGATDESDPPLWSDTYDVSKRAESVSAFIEWFLEDLEDGKYVYIPADEQRGSYGGEEPVLAPWYEFSPDELPDWDDRLDTDADVFDPSQTGAGLTFSGLEYDVTEATLGATARGEPPTAIDWRFKITAELVTHPGGISPPQRIKVISHYDSPESDYSAVDDWTDAAGKSVALNSTYERGEEPHVLTTLDEHVAVTDGEYEFVSLADGGVGLELSGRIDSRSGTNRPITIATPLEFEGELD